MSLGLCSPDSALPLDLLERLARDLLEKAEEDLRKANIAAAVEVARSFSLDERLEIAREVLGDGANAEEVARAAEELQMPQALIKGGEAAAQFFDTNVEVVTIAGEAGEERILDHPPQPAPSVLLTSEWDFYTPEDLEAYDGPESDSSYAFRIVRLCEAIKENSDLAIQLAMQLGAITREWEVWRENEEFLRAGRKHFAQQSKLAKSKAERPWMVQVRQDLEAGRIGNAAEYARKLKRRRDLQPPGVELIRNFVSQLRGEAAA